MRATYANGVLAALEEADDRDWHAVYGTSAGGALAAWFAAGQARFALDTWRYAQDRRVMSYRRWITRRGPLLDHDTMFRVVYEAEAPLDVEAVKRAPFAVVVTATDVETGETRYVDVRRGPVLDWLRATGRLPLGTGPAVEIEGRRFVDGGVTDPIPVERAIADGHDDIVCVLNRPAGARAPEPRYVSDLVGRYYPALADAVRDHHGLHNRAVALAERPPAGVRVRIIRPTRPLAVGRLTRDLKELRAAMDAGFADGQAFVERARTAPPA